MALRLRRAPSDRRRASPHRRPLAPPGSGSAATVRGAAPRHCLAAIEEELGDLERVRRFVKLWGYVNSAPGFSQQHVVMDGASSFLLSLFGERAAHARTSVGVAELPFGIPVEVDMVVEAEAG